MTSTPTFILAPIRGITDAVYREAFARCFGGFDGAVAPFFQLRQGQPLRPAELRQVAPEHNRLMPVVPQVLTNHPQSFTAALRELQALGHSEVNWNLGCPYPMVAGRTRGSGLLPHPERIDAILAQVVETAPVRISVKLRLGYQQPDDFLAVLEVLNRYPLASVTLHSRTASQMYEGQVDVARARQCFSLCRHPFAYNGDITTPAGFLALRQQLPGVSSWMIGRGALANPFLPAQLKGEPPPTAEIRRRKLREFHDRLFEGYAQWLSGPGHRLDKMKEHWNYLSLAFANPRQAFNRIRHSQDLPTYAAAVDQVFSALL